MLESSTVARFNTSESLEEDTMEDIDATLAEMDTFSELPSKRPLKAEAKWLQRVVVITSALPDSATKQRLLLELQARRMVLDLKDDNWSDATTELFQDLFNSTESKSSRTIAYCAAKARSKGRRKDTNGNMGGFTRRREHNNLCSSIPVDEREVVVMGKARRLGRGGRLAPSRRTYQANRHSPPPTPQRRLDPRLTPKLDEMVRLGVISPCTSGQLRHSAPLFAVAKGEHDVRPVHDLRDLNAITAETRVFRLFGLKRAVRNLKRNDFMLKIDLASGYHQMGVAPTDSTLLGIVLPNGQAYRYNMLFFLVL
ncbi:hypothetical protein J8273_5140 [Carpediemonas membranifera]|uniref:Reverse transcriptase domain-containing protein n=1 Tax=Carpediemonas membranifera TaxID=201153 RepID=A0A8J6B3G1_9EUKA|nr:hypothetical protein J8273_5140 [Carpediemonas membranifera]|eukprot:KAG9392159.1 hypothetical protein J8273_5140 [Carpediemonas membranifera]